LSSRIEDEYGMPRGVPMSTGLFRLDNSTLGGPRRGSLWLLSGFVSQGKTALGKEVAYSAALNGHRVLFVSLEMSLAEVRSLFVVRHSHSIKENGVPLADVLKDTLDDEDREAYFKAARSFSEKGGIGERLIVWVPEEDVTADDVIRHAESVHRRTPLSMLIIDYSELLIPLRRRQQYRIELAETIRRLKVAAGTFGGGDGVAVILLHQVSRKGYEKACKRGYYLLSDLAETAAAERHSNVVLWILQTEDMVEDHEVLVGISKQRMGPRDLIKGTKMFENFERAFIGNMQF
jgi:replicative DNA helicase